jgi:hypothetical protein
MTGGTRLRNGGSGTRQPAGTLTRQHAKPQARLQGSCVRGGCRVGKGAGSAGSGGVARHHSESVREPPATSLAPVGTTGTGCTC